MGMNVGASKFMIDINVTPLVDVCLVLLIIFMVVTPMLKEGVAVQLPETENGEEIQEDKKEHVTLTIKDDGTIYIENVEVKGVVEDDPASNKLLEEAIRSALRMGKNKPLLIKADARLKYGAVKRVMDIVKDSKMLKWVKVAADKAKEQS